jgi:hypothetical protein
MDLIRPQHDSVSPGKDINNPEKTDSNQIGSCGLGLKTFTKGTWMIYIKARFIYEQLLS